MTTSPASTTEFVRVERRPDGVAVIRLDRPKANALSGALCGQLLTAVREFEQDMPGAVVVWGGERIFAAGAEISEFGGAREAREIAGRVQEALDAVAAIPRVVVAAVNGVALGGGCELALACDLRVAAGNSRFGQAEILLGIIPGAGGTQRLPRLIGPARAKEMVLSGRQVLAEEALRIGLVDRVVPAEEVFEHSVAWAAQFAAGPVLAHGLAKQAIDRGLDKSLGEGLQLEMALFQEVFTTEDACHGVASFLANGPGKATFVGR
jgi:enoyl-CoA hydratase